MNQDHIRNIYDLIHKGQYQTAVKQCTNFIDRLKAKFKDGGNNALVQDVLLQLTSLRGFSYSRLGNFILAEDDLSNVMKVQPLNEEIIVIAWHYYVINGSFLSGDLKLKELADYLQNASSKSIISEQLEIDNLSLLYYLKDFNTMKTLCNKYLKRSKNPYFLALSILISFSIYQNQLLNSQYRDNNSNVKEDMLLVILANKFLNENIPTNDLNMYDRRVISMIYLIKLFVFRHNNEFKNYLDCINEISTLEKYLYPCINNSMIQQLKNWMILQNLEFSIHDSNKEMNYLAKYKIALIDLIKNFTDYSNMDWDNLRIIKVLLIRIVEEILILKAELNDNNNNNNNLINLNDNLSSNTSPNLYNSQSTQITNSSSFQTQSTITSIYGNLHPLESDSYFNLLDNILNIINIYNEDEEEDDDYDEDYYRGKNKLTLFFLTELKGRILLLELYTEILHCMKKKNIEYLNNGFSYENLLHQTNMEILRLIDSNNINIIVDLRVALHYYFISNLNYNDDHIIVTILKDLTLLLNENILEIHERKNIDLDFFTSRIEILTMFHQIYPRLNININDNQSYIDELILLDLKKIILILKNNLNENIASYFLKTNSLRSSYTRFFISISLYCLSISREDMKSIETNSTGISIFILTFLNNYIIDNNTDYFVSNLLSEILPMFGLYSISHNIRYNILNIKRSQITTLNVYGNYQEMISCPFVDYMNNNLNNSDINYDSLYTIRSTPIKDHPTFRSNIKMLFNSYFDIYNELRETCIESLREGTFSLDNLFEASKIHQEISSNFNLETLMCHDFLNNIFSIALSSLSIKRSDTLNIIIHLFDKYKHIIKNLMDVNMDNTIDNLSSKSTIKHDLSPIISYYTPIYDIEYSFSKVSKDLFPKNLFNLTETLDILEFENITSIPKFNMEILRLVNGVPKLKYKLTQRLRISFAPLILISDLIAFEGKMNTDLFNSMIDNLKDSIISSKYSKLFTEFDMELFNNINLKLMKFIFDLINSNSNSSSQKINNDDIGPLIEFINSKISDFSKNWIIKKIEEVVELHNINQLNHHILEDLLERLNFFILGPIFIICLAQSWLISNCSKKQMSSIYKILNKSHIKILEDLRDQFVILSENFKGTIEIKECIALCDQFNLSNFQHLKNNHFNLNANELVNSQLITINNISNNLNFIINSLENSLK
ncbi:hypothetical protein OIY81_839 [Cryptosporidium canis]|nr:hypothetical protein OIY81_839 [Cryptosporidium canis]